MMIIRIILTIVVSNTLAGQSLSNCRKIVQLGGSDLCLPAVNGYVEAFNAPVLNLKLNQTKDNITTSYSYYLNDAQFQSIDKLQDIPLNDWFKIYMVSEMENVPITTDQFKTFSNIISNGYIRENWTDLNERIKDFTNEIVINQPTLIESYSLASNTNSFVLLMPVRSAHDERTILMIMNNILVNNRMLFVAYYLNYEGPNSVKLANQRNDYFIYRFLEENTRQ